MVVSGKQPDSKPSQTSSPRNESPEDDAQEQPLGNGDVIVSPSAESLPDTARSRPQKLVNIDLGSNGRTSGGETDSSGSNSSLKLAARTVSCCLL